MATWLEVKMLGLQLADAAKMRMRLKVRSWLLSLGMAPARSANPSDLKAVTMAIAGYVEATRFGDKAQAEAAEGGMQAALRKVLG